ncbi:MAG: response regulator [Candidatus Rokuibacteriota bacterium]
MSDPEVHGQPSAETIDRLRPVLIADDDADLRSLMREFLGRLGLTVLEAANGLEALWAVKQQRPRVVMVDLTMPRLGGLDTIRHIRNYDRSIRVVAITGGVSEEAEVSLQDWGVPILRKPLSLHAIVAAVSTTGASER